MKLVLIVMASLALPLVGCAPEEFNDGYQFGDITHMTGRELVKLEQARKDYCNSYSDALIRRAALAYIRTQYPLMPENGICS
ncbi:hypothetical protein [Methylobacter sp.]|jgi:hypothetical protein|uniref:hypothetical protein n=1 Tax=Methylobacter sp. TaxID=2051955 RepID=UPI003DA2053F